MSEIAPQSEPGYVDWGDTSFQPEPTANYGDSIRWFRMSQNWPENPIDGRKFQIGGKERVALLEEQVYHTWAHRFSINYMGSGVNGTRRCTLEALGHCVACNHYESAPSVVENGKNVKKARCGRRQQQFGTNLLVYRTDLEGNLLSDEGRKLTLDPAKGPIDDEGEPKALVYEVYLWRFSADKFQDIREIKKEWNTLLNNDLAFILAPGKPENFQDFTPTVLPRSAWRDWGAVDKAAAADMIQYYKKARYDVASILGKEHSDEDMYRFLGIGGNGGQSVNPSQATADVAAQIEKELAEISPELVEPKQEKNDAAPADPAPTTGDFDELLKS